MATRFEKRSALILEKATAALPQTTSGGLFRITGGKIRLLSIVGEVTTVIQTQANATKLTFDPAGTGSSIDLCATLDITADAVGTLYSITGTLATAMKSTSVWLIAPADDIAGRGMVLAPGDILLDCAASSTGNVKWTINYELVDRGGNVATL